MVSSSTEKKNVQGTEHSGNTASKKEDAEIVDMVISRCWQGTQVENSGSQLEMPLYMIDC